MEVIVKRLLNRLHNISLKTKFIAIIALTLIFALGSTFVTQGIIGRAYNDVLYERTVQLLTIFSQNIQAELERAVSVSYAILGDNVIQSSLSTLKGSDYRTDAWMHAYQMVNNRLMNISLLHNDIQAIRLETGDGTVFTRCINIHSIPIDLIHSNQQRAHEAAGREVWIADPANTGMLLLLRDIREVSELTLEPIATLAISVDLKKIVNRCCTLFEEQQMPLLCAIELDGIRVYSSFDDIPRFDIDEKHYRLLNIDDETYFCVRYSEPETHWAYTALLNHNRVMNSVRTSTELAIVVALVTLAVAFLLCSLLMISFFKHIKSLFRKFDLFAHGQWPDFLPPEQDLYWDRKDEIGEIHRQFDQMAFANKKMIEENYEKQKLLLEAQLHQLKAQIQPHFLYNTLESISCLAISSENEPIADMAASLGNMLRKTLKDTRDMIPLEEDLSIAQDYLKIQMIRYGEQLKVGFDVDEKWMQVMVPAMTIQPLVENAVLHGAEQMVDICAIRVTAEECGAYLDITVEDNGPGMDEDILDKLERGEVVADGLGIGLTNIHRRLCLTAHDEACGLTVHRSNERTRVTVRVLKEVSDDDPAVDCG